MKSSTHEIVINTGPVIALVAATDSLGWLASLYRNVWLPHEVEEELSAGGTLAPEPALLRLAEWADLIVDSRNAMARIEKCNRIVKA